MTTRECIKTLNDRSASIFLILLLGGDLIYIAMHCLNTFALTTPNSLLDIHKDGGFAEMYQYLKFIWIVGLLLLIAHKNRAWRYLVWVGVFVYLLVDDSSMIHERFGRLIAASLTFTPPLGLRLQDVGELTVSAIAGSILLIPIILAYRGGSQVFRKTSQDITLLILLLVFFGVVVDMVHMAINLGWTVGFIVGVIEDGGEMLSVSLLAWYVFLRSVRDDIDSCYFFDFVPIPFVKKIE
jgi:hypothetical protein